MPRPKKNPLPPLDWNGEGPGRRLARLRKEHGLTQTELGRRIGITQSMMSDYEIGRSHLPDDMITRFAGALEISADDILGLKKNGSNAESLQLRFVKRIQRVQSLAPADQKHILKTLDSLIRDAESRTSDRST